MSSWFDVAEIGVLVMEHAVRDSLARFLRAKVRGGGLSDTERAVLRALEDAPHRSFSCTAIDAPGRKPFEALEQVQRHLARLRLQANARGATLGPSSDDTSPQGKRRC